MSERWTSIITKMVFKLGLGELIFCSPSIKGLRVRHGSFIWEVRKALEDVLALTISIILTPANVISHAQDIPLEPVQFLQLGCNGWNPGRFSATATCITHERASGSRSGVGTVAHKAFLIHFLVGVRLHSMVAEFFTHSVLDHHHDEGAIWDGDPFDHGLKDFIEDEVHNIHPESILAVRSIILYNPLGQAEQVCQRSYQILIVATTRRDGGREDDHELVI